MRDVSLTTLDGVLKDDYSRRRKVNDDPKDKPKRVGPEMRFRTVSKSPKRLAAWADRDQYSEEGTRAARPAPKKAKPEPEAPRRVGPPMRFGKSK